MKIKQLNKSLPKLKKRFEYANKKKKNSNNKK